MIALCFAAATVALGLLFLREIADVVRAERQAEADDRAAQAAVARLLSELDLDVRKPLPPQAPQTPTDRV